MPPTVTTKKKNTYSFLIGPQQHLSISSNFDGGNISLIKQINQLQYRLQCVPDDFVSKGKKSWFYFSAKVQKQLKVKFTIENINIYDSMYQQQNWPKPVHKIGLTGKWLPIKSSYLIYRDQVNLIIEHLFTNQQPVFFALSIPFTYYEMENYLHDLKFTVPQMIDYKDEVIKETKFGRNLHLLTLQDKQLQEYKNQSGKKRSIILITSRVHPGEVSSTYCLMGMLQFILKPFSLQSQILRKMFTFMIIPIVNPDGVYEGNYRMDLQGQNLNRVYLQPDFFKHETIYAIKSHIQELIKNGDKIIFHFDLHAHSCMKRSFIYGNAFDDIIIQTQTELFCKILDQNCAYFQQNLCQFGERHMKFKDKGQAMTKQGCARVVLSKMASITYSYTIQSSIFPVQQKNNTLQRYQKTTQINLDFKVANKDENFLHFSFDNFQNEKEKYSDEPNVIDQNKNLGIKIMLSVLQLMIKNPYSPLGEKQFDQMRKEIAVRILQSEQRFKMLDTKAYHKSKFISHFAKNQFQTKFKDQWSWLASCSQFQTITWPQGFTWFKKQTLKEKPKKITKLKTENRQQRIYTRTQNQSANQKKNNLKKKSDRLIIKTQNAQSQELKTDFQRLPLIRRSLQTKKLKTQQKHFLSPQKKLQKTEHFKPNKNIFPTNRSNILLTYLQDSQQKRQQRIISKKRILSLKMASINKNSGQKPVMEDRINQIIFESLENDFPELKPSHSQGQLPISVFGETQRYKSEQGQEFQDKFLQKNVDIKKSRKQLMNRKISMLKKINETKKANKNSLMKFPQIGKSFLITNARNKIQKAKKNTNKHFINEKSTIQRNQQNFINEILGPEINGIIKLKTQTSIS